MVAVSVTRSTAQLVHGIAPGHVLVGKYRVERVLGVGGMGVVLQAHHLSLDETVALKFLSPDAAQKPEAVDRFEREARAVAKIKSDHVARVLDVGVLENGAPYMVMEYLEGSDLSEWLAESGPFSFEQAVDFVVQACEALAEAHVLGIVHRDLKPANLFCTQRPDGQLWIKVLDFGISKVSSPSTADHRITATHSVMGSPVYMSPEQMQSSRSVDARSDVWALGVILFELLTGKVPFDAPAVTELAIKVATEPAPLLRSLRADAPETLELVIARCLEKDRELRFQSVGELALALHGSAPTHARTSVDRVVATLDRATSQPIPSVPTSMRSPPMTSSNPSLHAKTVVSVARRDARRLKWLIAGGVLVVGLATLAVARVVVHGRTTAEAQAVPPVVAPEAAAATSSGEQAVASPPPTGGPTASIPAASSPALPSSREPSPARPQIARPGRSPATAPDVSPPAAKRGVDCNPTYYYDANNMKHFKPECFAH